MKKEIRLIITEGEADMLGNDENAGTSVAFVGADSFVTMLFGGRDGSARDSITIDELRDIAWRVGEDVDAKESRLEADEEYATLQEQLYAISLKKEAVGKALEAAQSAFDDIFQMNEDTLREYNDIRAAIVKAQMS